MGDSSSLIPNVWMLVLLLAWASLDLYHARNVAEREAPWHSLQPNWSCSPFYVVACVNTNAMVVQSLSWVTWYDYVHWHPDIGSFHLDPIRGPEWLLLMRTWLLELMHQPVSRLEVRYVFDQYAFAYDVWSFSWYPWPLWLIKVSSGFPSYIISINGSICLQTSFLQRQGKLGSLGTMSM